MGKLAKVLYYLVTGFFILILLMVLIMFLSMFLSMFIIALKEQRYKEYLVVAIGIIYLIRYVYDNKEVNT